MEKNTHLGNSVEVADDQSQYDAEVKSILADKQVLARIVKYAAKEFKNYEIDQIIDCIEGTPEVSTRPIYPGKTTKEKITGLPTESKIPNEGEVYYDIRFHAVTPDKNRVKIFLNIEAQKTFYVGYHLVPRGIFYCARMLSEQLDAEFTTENYDEMKKVYSIWICMETPKKIANTITEYHMCEDDIVGTFEGYEPYDFLSVIMVRLSGKEVTQTDSELIGMLSLLFASDVDVETKKRKLRDTYQMKMTEKMEGGISGMSNLGEWVMEKGIERGIAMERCNVIRNLYKTMSVEEIVSVWNYEESFVVNVVNILKENQELSSKEIVKMIESEE